MSRRASRHIVTLRRSFSDFIGLDRTRYVRRRPSFVRRLSVVVIAQTNGFAGCSRRRLSKGVGRRKEVNSMRRRFRSFTNSGDFVWRVSRNREATRFLPSSGIGPGPSPGSLPRPLHRPPLDHIAVSVPSLGAQFLNEMGSIFASKMLPVGCCATVLLLLFRGRFLGGWSSVCCNSWLIFNFSSSLQHKWKLSEIEPSMVVMSTPQSSGLRMKIPFCTITAYLTIARHSNSRRCSRGKSSANEDVRK